MTLPTTEAYSELQDAFDHFNRTLFAGTLPPCLITFRSDRCTMGYFSGGRFVGRDTGELVDEIAINAGYFGICPIKEILQTLVHEMVHQWQHHHGKPGRGRYHNKEWADKMQAIGLMPSDTGESGLGREAVEPRQGVLAGEQGIARLVEGAPPDDATLAAGGEDLEATVRLVKLPEQGAKLCQPCQAVPLQAVVPGVAPADEAEPEPVEA